MKITRKTLLILAASPLLFSSFAKAGVDKYLNAGAGGTVWDTSTLNWGTSASGPYNATAWVNGNYDFAHFAGTGGTVTLNTSVNANYVYFDADGYTLSGTGTLVIGNPGSQCINITSPGASATINTIVNSTYNTTYFNEGSGTLTLAGAGSQFNGMTIQAGTVKVTAAMSNSGATTISGGTLRLTGSGSLGSSAITVNSGGTLDLSSSGGSSVVTVSSGGVLTGTGTTTGNITFNGGSTLLVNADAGALTGANITANATTNVQVLGAPADHSASALTLINYTGTTPGTANFSATGYRGGVIADDTTNKKITFAYKTLAGTWAGAAGNTTWDVGATTPWTNGGDGKFYNGDTVTFDDTATSKTVTITGNVMASSVTVNTTGTYTFSGTGSIAGAGSLTKSGTGTLVLSNANTFTGGIRVTDGELYVTTSNGTGNNTITLSGNSTLRGVNQGGTVSSFGSGLITVEAGATATIIHTQQNAVTTNNYLINGATTFKAQNISAGGAYFGYYNNINSTLAGSGPITLQDTSVGGGALYWSLNCSKYTGTVAIADGSEVVLFNGAGLGSGAVTMGATTTLRRSAGTNISVTDLTSAYTTATVTDGSAIIVNSVNGSTYAGKISGAGTFTKTGSGTLTLSGANNYTGATAVSAGTLKIAAAGSINIGAAGVTVAAASSLAVDGKLVLTSTTPGLIANSGTVALNAGSSVLDLNNLFNGATVGQTYNLISGGTTTGNFNSFANYTGGLNVAFDSATGSLSFTAVPEPSTYGLLGAGALALAAGVRRRRLKPLPVVA